MTIFSNALTRIRSNGLRRSILVSRCRTASFEIHIRSADELMTHPEWIARIRSRRHGVIQVRDRGMASIHFRRWAKVVTIWHTLWGTLWMHARRPGDFCELHYDAPRSCPDFLVIKWAYSHRQTTYQSTCTAMKLLDQVAAIRQAQAIVFQVSNDRITDRAAQRFGYQRHAHHLPGRNYIKRLSR